MVASPAGKEGNYSSSDKASFSTSWAIFIISCPINWLPPLATACCKRLLELCLRGVHILRLGGRLRWSRLPIRSFVALLLRCRLCLEFAAVWRPLLGQIVRNLVVLAAAEDPHPGIVHLGHAGGG